ncbi:MAG: hypothetical protein SGARI_000593 [Bacillariaceae sp.]
MSQRRGGKGGKAAVSTEEMVPFSEALDQPTSSNLSMDRESMEMVSSSAPSSGNATATTIPAGNGNATAGSAVSMDARFDAENKQLKVKAWKEGPFATGFVPPTWEEEYHNYRTNPRNECMKIVENESNTPCGCCSAMCCSMLGAGRVGNMAVFRQSTEWVDEVIEDENGETTRNDRPDQNWIVSLDPTGPCCCMAGNG